MIYHKKRTTAAWINLWIWLGQQLVWYGQMVQLILVRVSKPASKRRFDW